MSDPRGKTGYGGLGAPPPDHPRRCQARDRKNPAGICKWWAIRGYKYCRRHLSGGDRKQWIRDRKNGDHRNTEDERKMVASYYGEVLGPTLAKAVELATEQTDPDLWSVRLEVGVARGSMATLIRRAKRLQEQYDQLQGARLMLAEAGLPAEEIDATLGQEALELQESTERQLITVNSAIRQGMEEISRLAERGHRITRDTAVTLTVDQVQALMEQLVRILDQVCERHGEVGRKIAMQFEELFRETVNLPKARSETVGTLITPDRAAIMMDDSIGAPD